MEVASSHIARHAAANSVFRLPGLGGSVPVSWALEIPGTPNLLPLVFFCTENLGYFRIRDGTFVLDKHLQILYLSL